MCYKKIKKITSEKASEIIEFRKPFGLFYIKEGGFYIAIDNTTGCAWTEEFKTKEECLQYLNIF